MNCFISLSVLSCPLSSHQRNSTYPKVCTAPRFLYPLGRTSFLRPLPGFLDSNSTCSNLRIAHIPTVVIHCDSSELDTTTTTAGTDHKDHQQQKQLQQLDERQQQLDDERQLNEQRQHQWRYNLAAGSVVEAWSHGNLHVGIVDSLYNRGVNVHFADNSHDEPGSNTRYHDISKVSFGEIIAVWPSTLFASSNSDDTRHHLSQAIDDAKRLLRQASPKAINLSTVYTAMRRLPKNHPRSSLTSAEISHALFKPKPSHTPLQRAALTFATATLIASDSIHFKRSQPGHGWRALPPSVTVSRGRCSFIDSCNTILEVRSTSGNLPNGKRAMTVWSREQLDILRDLEVVAASGTSARGTSGAVLESLGYKANDDGAATLLLDINYWTTGHFGARPRKNVIPDIQQQQLSLHSSDGAPENTSTEVSAAVLAAEAAQQHQRDRDRDEMEWTFAPSLLAEARDLRTAARERRRSHMQEPSGTGGGPRGQNSTSKRRRSLLNPREGQAPLRAYCIDEKSSRFLDDAVSVRVVQGGSVIRLWLHIADVDEVVRSGSALDEFAKERGQSMYLPVKPLHMLPAAAMDAASFSATYATEAITVMVECDIEKDVVRHWEVFASVVPPVTRINYDQLDVALEHGAEAAQLDDEAFHDLKHIAYVAPLLAEKLDLRRSSRKTREMRRNVSGDGVEGSDGNVNGNRSKGYGKARTGNIEAFDDRPIASVKLVKRSDKAGSKGMGRIAKVVNFQMTGSHQAVNDILTCAGGVMRQFARENRAYLPEGRDAFLYVGRCGTAPLRRYSDLAIQRQIKCVLFGRQPAGKRRMDELKTWLAKRQAAAERTVSERRRSALFDSFSSFCAQKCAATGAVRATVRGQVRHVVVTKRGLLRVDVALDGTGLSATASVSTVLEKIVFGKNEKGEYEEGSGGKEGMSKQEWKLIRARERLRPRMQVQVEISEVDTVAFVIRSCIIQILD